MSYDLIEPDAALRDLLGSLFDRVEFVSGDVTDRDALRDTAARFDVTSMVHAAVITPRIDRERHEPGRIVEVNLGGTLNALEVARGIPDFRRFVYISSGAVWGHVPAATDLTEETPSHATSLYGVTKDASERIARRYGALFGMDVVALRPANVYGPMERVSPGFAGATEIREMLRIHADGRPILVNSLAGPYLDWTYVGDIAEGIERAWAAPERWPHDVYSLTIGRLFSIGDVLAAFARHLQGLRFQEVPEAQANYIVSGDEPGPIPSNARMLADFGWAPNTALEDGMGHYLAWVERFGPQ